MSARPRRAALTLLGTPAVTALPPLAGRAGARPVEDAPPARLRRAPALGHWSRSCAQLGRGRIRGTRQAGEVEGNTERGEGRGCCGAGARAGGRSWRLCRQGNRVKKPRAGPESIPEPQPIPRDTEHTPHPSPGPGPPVPRRGVRGSYSPGAGCPGPPRTSQDPHRDRDRQTSTAGCEEPVEMSNKWIPDAGKTVPTLAQE